MELFSKINKLIQCASLSLILSICPFSNTLAGSITSHIDKSGKRVWTNDLSTPNKTQPTYVPDGANAVEEYRNNQPESGINNSPKGGGSPSVTESKVDGAFLGWRGDTIVKLTNGSYWQQYQPYIETYVSVRPNVILHGTGPILKMQVEGTRQPVTVVQLEVYESRIKNEFEGWDGETIIKLIDGQIWQQAEYLYSYYYAYRPEVILYKSPKESQIKMLVEGMEEPVAVKRLR